jgi:hypothetical protein
MYLTHNNISQIPMGQTPASGDGTSEFNDKYKKLTMDVVIALYSPICC